MRMNVCPGSARLRMVSISFLVIDRAVVNPTIVGMLNQGTLEMSVIIGILATAAIACGGDDHPRGAQGGTGIDLDAGSSGDVFETSDAAAPEPGGADATPGGGFGSDGDSTGAAGPDDLPDGDTTTGAGDAGSTDSTGAQGTDETTGAASEPPTEPMLCGNQIYACGDMIDNDGDGAYDLDDPECTSPCDDDEGSFQTGLPGDNMDCHQDCFFDGNSGHGDDGCNWNLHCDPENPGAGVGCEYTGGNNCGGPQQAQSQQCLDSCQPLVPAGCDCFGCCAVELANGDTAEIFLNSGPDCSLDNLAACAPCTLQIETCGNACDEEGCELCFGQRDLPPWCNGNVCDAGADVCDTAADCISGYYCLQGCCFPEPAG